MCVYVRGRKLQKTRGAGLMDKGEMRKKNPILYSCLEKFGASFKVFMVLFLYY